MYIKKHFFIFIFTLVGLITIPYASIADEYVISVEKAKKLINKHIKFNPSIEVKVGNLYILDTLSSGKNTINYYNKLEDIGLIDLKKEKVAYGSSKLTISLTEKANKYKQFNHEHNDNLVAFSDGAAKVDKIIKIDDDNNVLFKFTYTPKAIFKSEFGLKKSQFYGKAFINYDTFKEKYVFNGYVYKNGITKKYKKDNWTYKKKDRIVYSDEIKGLENLFQ